MSRLATPSEPEHHPVLSCTIQGSSAFKLDGEGSGKLTLTFDSSQADVVAELYKYYRECEMNVAFIKVAT